MEINPSLPAVKLMLKAIYHRARNIAKKVAVAIVFESENSYKFD